MNFVPHRCRNLLGTVMQLCRQALEIHVVPAIQFFHPDEVVGEGTTGNNQDPLVISGSRHGGFSRNRDQAARFSAIFAWAVSTATAASRQ